jgi:long-chain-fatty-acid--CoA ligase ACSBG
MFVCVPRVWEKMEERISAIGAQTTGLKKKIATWAKSKAPEGTFSEETGKRSLPIGWGLAKKLVFDKIKQNLGLDECKVFVFSAAPMRESTREFFLNLNIFLQNCYGMS